MGGSGALPSTAPQLMAGAPFRWRLPSPSLLARGPHDPHFDRHAHSEHARARVEVDDAGERGTERFRVGA